ncbi:MAG: Gldg family protein [Phycisphaerae bacterium]|nr:Gldg family protein [Phycisphaerae bacterium]
MSGELHVAPPRRLATTLAIAKRELLATFATPAGYVTVGLVATLLCAIFVAATFRTGEPATLRAVLLAAAWTLLAASPAIAMRSFSDEFRQGTWETLIAAPIRPWQAVVGKFLACAIFLVVVLAIPVAATGAVLELHANPDWGEIGTGFAGLVLAGSAFIAMGILASTLTSNQLVAFLVPVFVLFALTLGSRALAAALPAEWAPAAFAAEPLRRVEDFILGLVDTSNVVYFVAITVASLVLASVSLARVRDGGFAGRSATRLGRLAARGETALFALAVIACVGAATALGGTASVRREFDATKTRAYSLSTATEELLAGLDGQWTIALLLGEDSADPASLRRVDEVLERMREANANVTVERIDPLDPASAARYDALLERLEASDAKAIAAWRPAIDRSFAGYDALRAFAREQNTALQAALATAPADLPIRPQLEQLSSGLLQLTDSGDAFIAAVRDLLRTSEARPLPDWDGARSALVANDRLWADQFGTVATLAKNWSQNPQLPPQVRAWAASRGDDFDREAAARRAEQYELEELPDLGAAGVSRVIGQGECAVILSPRGAAAIPSWQIVPARANLASNGARGRATLGYDFAARAEQILAGAIRSLTIDTLPTVVFVHAEDRSLLERREDRNELVAMADALRTARFGVREWPIGLAEKPTPARGERFVYAVLPPLKRDGLQVSERERRLLEVTRSLLSQGEPTLVTFARNLLPVFGQKDPWEIVAADLGLRVDTGRVILELLPVSADRTETRPWQEINRFESSHPIGAAINGQLLVANHPTPIMRLDGAPPNLRVAAVARVEPDANRWIEDDWRGDGNAVRSVPDAKRLSGPADVVVAVERPDGHRAVVVGSGGWLLSTIADASQSLGGDRFALTNPGNRALLIASVAWLAGLDPATFGGAEREVARIGEISDRTRATWLLILVAGLPVAVALVGTGVAMKRRRDA